MAEAAVLTAVGAITDALDAAGFDYALGGAIALAYWGVPRATVDVGRFTFPSVIDRSGS
jgi:hypothetical protein